MYKSLIVEYGDDSAPIEYRLRDYPVVQRWCERVLTAQQNYSVDEPGRFYGFGNYGDQVKDALDKINRCITTIKLKHPDIEWGYVESVDDQLALNFWHHVFETYHGLLGEELGNELDPVLADLNIHVHRCESVARGAQPRHVVTYYGLPKTEILNDEDYEHFADTWAPGTVFLNYAEIGKTLADLARDDDHFIGQRAFQPFCHISADFNVKFYAQTDLQARCNRAKMQEYYKNNYEWIGPPVNKIWAEYLPLADIVTPVDLDFFAQRQFVKSVNFI
jgi:hypothetical protein